VELPLTAKAGGFRIRDTAVCSIPIEEAIACVRIFLLQTRV